MQFRTTRHLEYILENYQLMLKPALVEAKRELDKRKRKRVLKQQANENRKSYNKSTMGTN